MRVSLTMGALLLALLAGTAAARAQKATEQFIPIGQSPGLSSIVTDIGAIAAANEAARTISLDRAAGGREVEVTERTRIWLDRSSLGRASLEGRFIDLKVGRQVEVKYEDDVRRANAEWIKVVPGDGG